MGVAENTEKLISEQIIGVLCVAYVRIELSLYVKLIQYIN
jgi:hypothetical protein